MEKLCEINEKTDFFFQQKQLLLEFIVAFDAIYWLSWICNKKVIIEWKPFPLRCE